ncbi:MAG TPA: hypothetical protein VFC84_13570 [Desulfosporosinus sp.]|nr:hypothetical protein [Desulfosporosinus sp.]
MSWITKRVCVPEETPSVKFPPALVHCRRPTQEDLRSGDDRGTLFYMLYLQLSHAEANITAIEQDRAAFFLAALWATAQSTRVCLA